MNTNTNQPQIQTIQKTTSQLFSVTLNPAEGRPEHAPITLAGTTTLRTSGRVKDININYNSSAGSISTFYVAPESFRASETGTGLKTEYQTPELESKTVIATDRAPEVLKRLSILAPTICSLALLENHDEEFKTVLITLIEKVFGFKASNVTLNKVSRTNASFDSQPITSVIKTLLHQSASVLTGLTADQIQLLLTLIVNMYVQPDSETPLQPYEALVLSNPLADHFSQLSPFTLNSGYLHLKAYQCFIASTKDRVLQAFGDTNKVGIERTIRRYGNKTAPAFLNQTFSDWEHIDSIPRNRLNMSVSNNTSSGFVL